jgi:hypothetical protein
MAAAKPAHMAASEAAEVTAAKTAHVAEVFVGEPAAAAIKAEATVEVAPANEAPPVAVAE